LLSLSACSCCCCCRRCCDRYFWAIAVGYMLPFTVIVGCMVTATAMTCRRNPAPTLEDDEQVVEEEVTGWLKEQRRMLKFLAALVVCWIVGNVPLIYILGGPQSAAVEALLMLVMVSHQIALPIAMLIWRRRLWSRLRRFVCGVRRRKPRTVDDSGTPTDCRSDEETAGNSEDVGGPRPEESSYAVGDARLELESESVHDGVNKGSRCVKFDGEAVHINQEGHQRLEDVEEQRDDGQLMTGNSFGHCSSGESSKLRRLYKFYNGDRGRSINVLLIILEDLFIDWFIFFLLLNLVARVCNFVHQP